MVEPALREASVLPTPEEIEAAALLLRRAVSDHLAAARMLAGDDANA
jgi:hypothetical protein